MKLKKSLKIKSILLFLILFAFLYKINPLKNFSEIINYKLTERLEKIYGYCGGESIGYLKFIKKKYKLNANPEIINFIHTPPNLWPIYEAKFNNYKSDKKIVLNYPGKKIQVELANLGNNVFELKDPYYLSTISNNINKIYSTKKNLKIDYLEFYKSDFKNNSNLLIKKKLSYKDLDKYNLRINLEKFKIGEKRLFIKIVSKQIYNKNSAIKLELQNKINLNDFKIIHSHKNCYFLN
tara:strand:+ start:360 stop:1070 length:711 start_codon:yes stop_codon:yes gene_type:complete